MKRRYEIDVYHRNEYVIPIAKHEVGHNIVARKLNFKAREITVEIKGLNGEHKAGSTIEMYCDLSGNEQIVDYLERRIIVLFAGVLAQTLFDGKVNRENATKLLEIEGANDDSKISELRQLIRNIKYPDSDAELILTQLQLISNELWERTIKIVEENSEIIEDISSRIASEIKYTHTPFTLDENELDTIVKNYSNKLF